ncbi:MAG: hypothetical protein C0600_14395 [Ignavibacteria bacterium]|nr:MAG: hypothetical protein C0600_14395 [Ignavibacteria bacterium]
MKTMEIIEIRAHAGRHEQLLADLERTAEEINHGREGMVMYVYRRAGVDTDFAVKLLHDTIPSPGEGSSVALRLQQALKDSGLVNHSVWIQHHPVPHRDKNSDGA